MTDYIPAPPADVIATATSIGFVFGLASDTKVIPELAITADDGRRYHFRLCSHVLEQLVEEVDVVCSYGDDDGEAMRRVLVDQAFDAITATNTAEDDQ